MVTRPSGSQRLKSIDLKVTPPLPNHQPLADSEKGAHFLQFAVDGERLGYETHLLNFCFVISRRYVFVKRLFLDEKADTAVY